jgi:ribonuclease Z
MLSNTVAGDNGEKIIFHLGTGLMRNIASLMISQEYLDKIFISHLNTDHWGELGAI